MRRQPAALPISKRIYKININGATVVNSSLYGTNSLEGLVDSTGLAGQSIVAVKKTLFMDLLANGWPSSLDKAEGLAIINDSTIAVANDNDYAQTSPTANGIATPTTNLSHVVKFGLKGSNKIQNLSQLTQTLTTAGITGLSSSQPPYLVPTTTSGQLHCNSHNRDAVNGYKWAACPTGLGCLTTTTALSRCL